MCKLDPLTQKFICSCNQYFTGSKCNIDTRPCSYGPCLNNATCTNTNLTSAGYVCECNEFYTGANCETQIDLCQNETCSSNGKCGIVDNKPKCKCFQYYSGEKCETKDEFIQTIKKVRYGSAIIAIIFVILFYSIIAFSDFLNYFIHKKNKSKIQPKRNKPKIYRLKYIN